MYFLQLVRETLSSVASNPDLLPLDGKETLVSKIAGIHIAYSYMEKELLCFSHLASIHPGIVDSILLKSIESSDVVSICT